MYHLFSLHEVSCEKKLRCEHPYGLLGKEDSIIYDVSQAASFVEWLQNFYASFGFINSFNNGNRSTIAKLSLNLNLIEQLLHSFNSFKLFFLDNFESVCFSLSFGLNLLASSEWHFLLIFFHRHNICLPSPAEERPLSEIYKITSSNYVLIQSSQPTLH